MNIIREITKSKFVKGHLIEKCPLFEFVLINEVTIRKEPSSASDPDIIELMDETGALIGIYKKINTNTNIDIDVYAAGSVVNCVNLWERVS